MIIKIPPGFIDERRYLLDFVFNERLGLDFKIELNTNPSYEIQLTNGNVILFEDHFFSHFEDGLGYLQKKNVPSYITYSENIFTTEENIPVIFGHPDLTISEDVQKTIYCQIDIFSSIFFMLTRWEEYAIKDRDKHGRFPEKLSLSIKNGINRRPVVDEYIEMLWRMLLFIEFKEIRKENKFEAVITHDVDQLIRYKNIFKLIRIIAGDIILRKKPSLIKSTIKDYWEIKKGIKTDNFDTFDFLMDQSEKINLKSHFYFLSQDRKLRSVSSTEKKDFRYDIHNPKLKSIFKRIIQRGHIIGIHGSYNSFDSFNIFSKEIGQLTSAAGKITESRQHYLRFSTPLTWTILNENNIKQDSTLGFNENIGFRCGTSSQFKVFDIISRQKLELIELPLTVMDGSALYFSKNPEDFFLQICSLIDIVKKYKGKFVLLWHTNSFNVYEWDPYQKYYSKIIGYLGSKIASDINEL